MLATVFYMVLHAPSIPSEMTHDASNRLKYSRMSKQVSITFEWKQLIQKCSPIIPISTTLIDVLVTPHDYEQETTGHLWLRLIRFWCFFVSKKTTNNDVMPKTWVHLLFCPTTIKMSAIKLSSFTDCFGVSSETNKRQNLMIIRQGIAQSLHY